MLNRPGYELRSSAAQKPPQKTTTTTTESLHLSSPSTVRWPFNPLMW